MADAEASREIVGPLLRDIDTVGDTGKDPVIEAAAPNEMLGLP